MSHCGFPGGHRVTFNPSTADWYRLVDETSTLGQGGGLVVVSSAGNGSTQGPWFQMFAFSASAPNAGNFGNVVTQLAGTQNVPIDQARVQYDGANHFAFDLHFTASGIPVAVDIWASPLNNPVTNPGVAVDLFNGIYLTVLPGGVRTSSLGIYGSLLTCEYLNIGAVAAQIYGNAVDPNGVYTVAQAGDLLIRRDNAGGVGLYQQIDNASTWAPVGPGVFVAGGAQTLAAGSPRNQVFTGAGAATWTLPAPVAGLEYVVKNRGSAVLTVASASAGQIYGGAPASSIAIAAGDAAHFVADGAYFNLV